MAKLQGSYTALITPMLQDGSVDYEGFRKNIVFQLEQGIDGLLPLGTSGETPTLDEDEEEKLLDVCIPLVREFNSKNGKDVKVLVGAGSTFKRPEGYFAGKLIQDAGLRGFQVGGAQVAEKHCGFVINKEHATAADILELIRHLLQGLRYRHLS